jgi:outer membrane protein insertion porin family
MSQDELLLLLTSSRSLAGRTIANTVGRQFGTDQRFLLSSDTFSSFRSFIRSLARIDALSLEPIYNPYTGALEPGVVGKKNITESLALVGESTFGTVSNSRAGLVYNLTPSLNASGFIESVSTRQNTALSADLTYTILAEQSRFLNVKTTGLEDVDEDTLLAAARLGPSSRVRNKPESLATVQRDVSDYLMQNGYLSATVDVSCQDSGEYCHELNLVINEGPRYSIEDIVTKGDEIPEAARPAVEKGFSQGEPALAITLRKAEERLIIALRNEGFIAARVTSTYEKVDGSSTVRGVLNVDLRQPISFVFQGNTVFTPAEFLDSIELFSRKRPFGNNTIHLLIQNIERMYQEKGYLFVQVTYEEDRSNPPRLTYVVNIKEDAPVKVRNLSIGGENPLPLKRIRTVMRELGFGDQEIFLDPEFAVPDQLESLKEILVSVFQQEGYPEAQVTYSISQAGEGSGEINVVYNVVPGTAFLASKIAVIGAPTGMELPQPPAAPSSLPRINRFITQVLDRLRDEGYLYPSVTTDFDPDTREIVVNIEPGSRTILASIEFEGLTRIKTETVRRFTTLKEGQPYRIADINTTKRSLFRSGLFSRVEVAPKDGNLDTPSEALVVRVAEQPLQTLEVGGGLNTEFGLHVFGEAVDKSLFADGRSIALRVDSYIDSVSTGVDSSGGVGIAQGFASARFDDPTFLDSEFSLAEELRFQRQNLSTQEYDLERISGSSYLYRQFESGFAMSAGHTILFDNILDTSPGAIISPLDTGSVRLSFLSASLTLDRRDDPLLPHSGFTFTLEPKLSMEALGSEANFASLTSRATAIVPLDVLSPRFSLGLGVTGGVADAFAGTDEIPITQRYYLGGRTTVRGFRENSLGPRGADGAVIGGDTMAAGSFQLQYLVNSNISTHVFLDAGNVFLRNRDPSYDIRTSTGFGFRYLSPIGPIGLDIGHPLDEKGGEPSVRLHFSVGSNF